jgi:hypothetical protein
MWIRRICVAVALVGGLTGAARAEDVVLELVPIHSAADCRTALVEYAWTCEAFDKPHWREFIEAVDRESKPFWDKYYVSFVKADIDKDGKDDVILKVHSALTCGVRNCDNYFFFSEVSDENSRHELAISSVSSRIYYRSNGEKHEIRFDDESIWFDINELKEKTHPSILF